MKRFIRSLYARLALVLLLALGASFATMYVLFLSHLEEARESHFARSIAAQVRLVEELLRTRPAADLAGLKGITLAPQVPAGGRTPHELAERLQPLRPYLAAELERDVDLVPAAAPASGFWVSLATASGQPRWLFIAVRKPGTARSESVLSAFLVGFGVFFAGGMVLLWQIQRPLKRLGQALEAVGQTPRPGRLPVAGAGEVRALAERYNDMVERLNAYEEDRATMLAGVAHDLRSPITRLRLLMELGQGTRGDDMLRNLDDIERITEQFLVYARGGEDEPVEERDMGLFIEEVVAPYAAQGVAVDSAADGTVVAVRADALRRAIANLVENALEYGQAPVRVHASRSRDQIAIAVEDAGPGIPPAQISRALRPFSRLDRSRGGKGHCGLGLVIAARIAEAHRGTLALMNREGGGFIAEIRLPAI